MFVDTVNIQSGLKLQLQWYELKSYKPLSFQAGLGI